MARRRLLTILATTVVAGGLSAAPAFAGPLDDLTGGLEDTVTTVTEGVQGVTDGVVDGLTGGASSQGGASTEGDPSTLDLGTGDGTLDIDLDVDVAPSDEDGSPQLEIDGGVTVADQEIDLGSATDPIEDAVDPDPAPAPSPAPTTGTATAHDTDGEASPSSPTMTGGRLPEGDGVVAASTGDGPQAFSPEDSPFARAVGEGFAGAGALPRTSFGVKRHGGDAMSVDQVPDPEVAPPVDTAVDSPWTAAPPAEPETPAVLATDTAAGATDDSPVPGLLRVIAAAMVLGTGAVWTRAFRRA